MEGGPASPRLQKWIRRCVKREFQNVIEESLEAKEECSAIAEKINGSREMSALVDAMRQTMIAGDDGGSRPETSSSFMSDLTASDWDGRDGNDLCSSIIDRISRDKPVHVRLAGYESLLNAEPTNAFRDCPSWDVLLKALVDGIADENRSVFEASLRVHAKFLHHIQVPDIFANLLNAFNGQYHSREPHEQLPTLISGVNYRLYSHEKLFRIMHLVINFQGEMLKSSRIADRTAEDVIEMFVIFLSTHSFGNALHPKTLTALNVLAILDPRADWSTKWMHGLKNRRVFVGALTKSPSLLQQALKAVAEGFEEINAPRSMPAFSKDPADACITGEVIRTITHLHCVNVLSQLCTYEAGRSLLRQTVPDTEFSIAGFVIDLFLFLDKFATLEVPQELYVAHSKALQLLLSASITLYDPRLYRAASKSLASSAINEVKIWPHVLDTMARLMGTKDGLLFIISEEKKDPMEGSFDCPAVYLVAHAAKLLKQPFSIMNVEYISDTLRVVEKLFDACHVYEVVHDVVENELLPTSSSFYSKIDNYYVENEAKTQQLDRAMRRVLLKIVSIPFGVLGISREPLLFEELIRGTIAPLRASWTIHVASFVSSAAYFDFGKDVLANLAPHVLTTLLSDTCESLVDPLHFYDPWDHENSRKLLHVLTLFGLNLKCLTAFTMLEDEPIVAESSSPRNLRQLLRASVDYDSPFHQLALLSLNAILWNLNVCVYLTSLLNFQEELLHFQRYDALTQDAEDEQEIESVCIINECSSLRSKILRNWWSIRFKYEEHEELPEECYVSSTSELIEASSTNVDKHLDDDSGYCSEFERFLCESKPGLHDNSWVCQARDLYNGSTDPIRDVIVVSLLEQMEKAIPTAEWVDCFKWEETCTLRDEDFWFPEDWHGIELTLRYAEQCRVEGCTAAGLKDFFRASYGFIKYTKPNKFDGFDWFLSTVYILCGGAFDRCKTFLTQFIRLQSSIYMWPALGIVIDRNNNEEGVTQFVFNQLLETIVGTELPHVKYALQSTCGSSWWQICNTMISQCFWAILPWNEILNYFVICVLYPPDYMLYYCVALLHYCQNKLMKDIANGKMWPESMVLDGYHCQEYVRFMDSLGKRYGNKILPILTLRKFYSLDEI